MTIRCSGDIGPNPGPKLNFSQSFSICHWNLNSVSGYNFIKVSLIRAYISVNKFEVICLLETFLDSTTLPEVPSYNLVRGDHPSNTKKGGVCIYYRDSLPLKVLDLHYLQECINFEIMIGNEICNFISLS